MHAQTDLFDPSRARRTDPGTSHAAADQAKQLARAHQSMILEVMRDAGCELGAEQIADRIGLASYQVRKRLPELQDQHLIEIAPGERKTSSGRTERLWRLASNA